MNRKMIVCLSLILFWSVTSVFGSTRTWTDDTGRFTVEADLEELRDDSVVLRRKDGGLIVVPLGRLSVADQDYLRGLSKAPKKPTPDGVSADGDVPSDSSPPLAIAPFDAEEARAHQEAWAEHLGVDVELKNSVGMQLRLIPPGEFMMGSPESEEGRGDDEGPQHRVRITRPFYLGVYLVTRSQWASVMGSNPRDISLTIHRRDRVFDRSTANYPMETVNWLEAQEFVENLNAKLVGMDWNYRLPTEAEWEYACRAGTATRYFFGDDERELGKYGWYLGNLPVAHHDHHDGSPARPIGGKRPNAWGLYDMHGTVWEWCSDWYGADYYVNSPVDDPTGPASGSDRVLRGGGFATPAEACRSARRSGQEPGIQGNPFGFRVVFSSLE